jgi:hypothetical protein
MVCSGRADRKPALRGIALLSIPLVVATILAGPSRALAAQKGAGGPTEVPLRPSGPLVPARGVLFGAYQNLDDRWSGLRREKRQIRSYERRLHRKLRIDHHFYGWREYFPGRLERWDARNGRIPMITWEPNGTSLRKIISGANNSLIRKRASAARRFGKPFFLRWAHEMNGNWYSWGGTPYKYVAAYRHIHDLFIRERALNVIWVWGPNNESVPSTSWNHWSKYYPGDTYVDWVAASGFNWGNLRSWSRWRSFKETFARIYNDYATRKPFMVAETGSTASGGKRGRWMMRMGRDLPNRMTAVAALVYFNSDPRWKLRPGSEGFGAFRRVVNRSYFKPPL